MSDFWLYVKLGFEHVLDINAYDHTLFIIALCASHTFRTWKRLLIHITLFTIGHSLSLALSSYNLLAMDAEWIEFLIPVTIIITALVSIIKNMRNSIHRTSVIFGMITFVFGLIHGFGFAGYFKMITESPNWIYLVEFALGIEMAQLLIALGIISLGYVARKLGLSNRYWGIIISTLVLILSIPMLIENWIWGS
jgi:hypothetical protein